MYLPREVELSCTWVFPGILLPPRKHIQIKIGKLANNLVLLAIDRVALPPLPRYTSHYLCTQADTSTWSSHASVQEVLKQSSTSQPCKGRRARGRVLLRVLGDTRGGD